MNYAVVGIDLGGTCTKFGLVTRGGELLASDAIPTDSQITYQNFFKHLYEHILSLKESLNDPVTIKGMGVGAPTGNYLTGTIDNASNLDWPSHVPVTEILASYSNLPTVLTNDANAATMGEMLYGTGRNMENFIAITLGTGLGCGLVINDKLVVGQNGHAGEIGHIPVSYDGRACKCGRNGCLETYVSAPGLIKTVHELMETTDLKSKLRKLPNSELDAKKITDAAREQDPLALEAFEYTGRILGRKLADIVACINPEAIIVSGGLSKAGSLILDPTKRNMEEQLLDIFKDQVEISLSSLAEKNAAILGAAAFVWKEMEETELTKSD